ncbi:MAG: AAA family ATPase [Nitrosomonadales bacterium]|nr:AAA family ATPase [Nitrosomonadales bacterium]
MTHTQKSNSQNLVKPKLPAHYFKKHSTPKPLEAMDLREFVRMPIPTPAPLLGNWLNVQGLCMIHGARGEGKTFLAFWIACAVAAGQDLFGWKCAGPKKVVYLDGEMSSGMLQARTRAIPKRMRPAHGMLKMVTPDFQPGVLPDLSNREEQELINAAIDPDTDLIVVDNLSSWSKSGREDSETWAPIAEWALRHRAAGRSIIFIHHSGKAGTQRGTSRREDLLDVVLALKKPPQSTPSEGACFEIRFEKNRHLVGEDIAPIKVRLTKDEDGKHDWVWEVVQDRSDERLVRMIKLKGQGLSQSQIAKKLGVDRATVCRALKKQQL